MPLHKPQFSYGESVHINKQNSLIDSEDLCQQTRHPSKTVVEGVAQIRELVYKAFYDLGLVDGSPEYRNYRKQHIDKEKVKLPFYIPGGICPTHHSNGSLQSNGIVQADFDFKEKGGDQKALALKQKLDSNPYVLFCALSPSGFGVKVLVQTDCFDNNHYSEFAETQVRNYFLEKYGEEMDTLSASSPCFMTHDASAYLNQNSQIFHVEQTVRQPRKTVNLKRWEENDDLVQAIGEIKDQEAEYNTYIWMGYALYNCFGQEKGGEVFDFISYKSSKYNQRQTNSIWRNIGNSCERNANREKQAGLTTILKFLKEECGINYKPRSTSQSEEAVDQEKKSRKSTASLILALADHLTLCHTPEGEAFALIEVNGHQEVRLIRSKEFRQWLARIYWQEYKSVANSQGIQDALATLEGKAIFEGETAPLFIRSAFHQGTIYVDLTNDQWQVVKISAQGWEEIESNQCPVFFRRSSGAKSIAKPSRSGNLSLLSKYFGNDAGMTALITGWLLGVLHPTAPCPVVNIQGGQGSGKSTRQEILRALIDPCTVPTQSAPREERDIVAAAYLNKVLSIDNISFLPEWLSDAFCRFATGAGYVARALFTDGESFRFSGVRAILLNGITEFATRGDLQDRSITVHLPNIDEASRKPLSEVWADFASDCPRIVGGLFDAMVRGIAAQPPIKPQWLHRMADWHIFVYNCLPNPEVFNHALRTNLDNAIASIIDTDLVAQAVVTLMEGREEWNGTSSDLTRELRATFGTQHIPKDFPDKPEAMGNRIKRIIPHLSKIGIQITKERSGNGRLIYLRRSGKKAVTTVTPVTHNKEVTDYKAINEEFFSDSSLTQPVTDRHNLSQTVIEETIDNELVINFSDGNDGYDSLSPSFSNHTFLLASNVFGDYASRSKRQIISEIQQNQSVGYSDASLLFTRMVDYKIIRQAGNDHYELIS
jgi:hypothetical protein